MGECSLAAKKIAEAVSKDLGIEVPECSEFTVTKGNGLKATKTEGETTQSFDIFLNDLPDENKYDIFKEICNNKPGPYEIPCTIKYFASTSTEQVEKSKKILYSQDKKTELLYETAENGTKFHFDKNGKLIKIEKPSE